MPDTQARIGYGGTLELAFASSPSERTLIRECRDFTLPSETTGTEDATHMHSPNRVQEFISTMTDPGELSFDMNLVPGSDSDRYLISTRGRRLNWWYTFPSGEQFIGVGERTGYNKSAPVEGRMAADVTIKVSGEPFLTQPTAPRAIVAPVIEGVAEVGAPLTLDPGIWAGAMEFEYQWQADGADIDGATGSSFVPSASHAEADITCIVTASNDDFDTDATTAAVTVAGDS